MAERGAVPEVHPIRRRALRAVNSLFSPLLPDDYLEMINPLWSTRELRGRIERIEPETDEAVTVVIRPGYRWGGHRPGQYLRVGVVVDGIHHWRAYSLTSEPGRADGCITITPKLVEGGKVSPYFTRHAKPGDIVRLGGVEGTFTLPEPLPSRLLMVSAGSGITPIACMLREIAGDGAAGGGSPRGDGAAPEILHVHCERRPEGVAFGEELRRLEGELPGYTLSLHLSSERGRLTPADLDELCPDWAEREAFVSGPAAMLDAMHVHWEGDPRADPSRLRMERFQPIIGTGADSDAEGAGGTVSFLRSGIETECEGGKSILVAGEEAGLKLKHGCRMGICHTCVGRLCSGRLRDLRTGEVVGADGEMVRICVNAPEGPVELTL